jgi:oligopeptide/dipeptide ABC transporter ATP-binding protein
VRADLLVHIKDLFLDFSTFDGITKVLNGVELKLRAGDVLGLVGETGCGKTLTGLSIARLVPCPPGQIVGGQILFKGEDLLHKSESDMRQVRGRQITLILQDPLSSLNPVFTIGEQMTDAILCHEADLPTFALSPMAGLVPSIRRRRREAAEIAVEWLDRVWIPDAARWLGAYPHELSGGMRQRVQIAMALARQPELVVADEPTTALDVSTQAEILELVQQLVDDFRLSILLISHNFSVVAKVCRQVAVMYAGNVVEWGPIEEVTADPRHPYTMGLLQSIPRRGMRRGGLRGIPGTIPSLLDPPPGCRFHPRCSKVMSQCSEAFPPAVEVTPGHEVSCYLYC